MTDQDEQEFLVDHIYQERKKKNKTEYKVRWHGFSAEDDTWESEDDLRKITNGLKKVQEYKDSLKPKSKKDTIKSENDKKSQKSSPVSKTPAKSKSSKSQSSKSNNKLRDQSSPSPPPSPVIPKPAKKSRLEESTDKPEIQVSTPKKPKIDVDPFALTGAAKSVFLTPAPKPITKKPDNDSNGDKTDDKLSSSKDPESSTSNGSSKDTQPLESTESNSDEPTVQVLAEPKAPKICGFDKGYEAESISNATKIGGRIFLKIHWKDDGAGDELVPSDIARFKCPQLLIQFYQKRLFWGPKKESSD